jgi:hypothetical protein
MLIQSLYVVIRNRPIEYLHTQEEWREGLLNIRHDDSIPFEHDGIFVLGVAWIDTIAVSSKKRIEEITKRAGDHLNNKELKELKLFVSLHEQGHVFFRHSDLLRHVSHLDQEACATEYLYRCVKPQSHYRINKFYLRKDRRYPYKDNNDILTDGFNLEHNRLINKKISSEKAFKREDWPIPCKVSKRRTV